MKRKIFLLLAVTIFIVSVCDFNTLAQSGQKFSVDGNILSTGDFIGSTNNQPLLVKVNNALALEIKTDGSVLINSLTNNDKGIVTYDGSGKLNPKTYPNDATKVFLGDGSWGNVPIPANYWLLHNNDLYTITPGNIGIGTDHPMYKMDVLGSVRISENLYVGGGIIITEKVNASKEIISGSIKADSILMDSTKAFYGYSKFEGDVKLKNKLEVVGNTVLNGETTINGNFRTTGNLTFAGNKTISYVPPQSGSTGNLCFGTQIPAQLDPCFSQVALINNNWFGGSLKIWGNPEWNSLLPVNILTVGSDGANGVIDIAGTTSVGDAGLLINYYCGRNVVVGGGGPDHGLPVTGDFSALHSAYLAVNSGSVGIGTTTTDEKLTVDGNIHSKGNLINGGPDFILGINDNRANPSGGHRALVHDGWDFNLDELTVNYDGDFIDGVHVMGTKTYFDGNVGIGLIPDIIPNSPKLDVNGEVKIRTLNSPSGSYNVLVADDNGLIGKKTLTDIGDHLGNHTATTNLILGNNWLSNNSANPEGIFINSANNVGIGTFPGHGKLEIKADGDVTLNEWSQHPFVVSTGYSAGDQLLLIGSDKINQVSYLQTIVNEDHKSDLVINALGGNVGVGTNAPVAKLDIVGGDLRIDNIKAATGTTELIQINDNGILSSVSPAVAGMGLWQQSTDVNNINNTNTGNVGLGTNNPVSKLQIGDASSKICLGNSFTIVGGYYNYDTEDEPEWIPVDLWYNASYMGFNAGRNSSTGLWHFNNNLGAGGVTAGNGGSVILNSTNGWMRFIPVPSSSNTGSAQDINDNDLLNQSQLLISRFGVGIGPNAYPGNIVRLAVDGNSVFDGLAEFRHNVGIGINLTNSNNPNNYRLAVNGSIGANEVFLETDITPWPDYVFDKNYKLLPLNELENFIDTCKHLPDIPSAGEIKEKGIAVGEMNTNLLKKIEELTLYLIKQDKVINRQQLLINELKEKTDNLEKMVNN